MERRKQREFEQVVRSWNRKNALRNRPHQKSKINPFVSGALAVNAIGAMALGVPSLSWAQESNDEDMSEVLVVGQQEQKETFKAGEVSSPKYTQPLRDIPQTIAVIPQELMESQGSTTLREVLRNVPGISIQAGEGGTPAGDQLSIRGFSARTDLFIDGVRDFGGYTRDPFNFEQVEVAKGPASAYSGRGSTGGSINLVSKSPTLEPSYDGSIGYGTDQYFRTSVDINQPITLGGLEGAALRLNALWHQNEATGRDVAEDQRWGVAPSLAFGLDTDTRLTLSYFHLGQDNIPDYGIPWIPSNNVPLSDIANQPAPVDWHNFYGLKARDYEEIATDLATVEIEHDVDAHLSWSNLTRVGYTYRDSIITAPRFASTTSTDIRRTDVKSRDQKDFIAANQTNVNLKFETGSLNHDLVSGLEVVRETQTNYNRIEVGAAGVNTDLYHPNPDDIYSATFVRNGAKAEAKANSVGLYAFDNIELGEYWEVNGGIRWDRFSIDFVNNSHINYDRVDDLFSWQAGLVFKPTEMGSVYFGYGTSFNPAGDNLALSNGSGSNPQDHLEPEETRSFELGTKWDLWDERLGLTAAVFHTEKTNAFTDGLLPSDPPTILDGEQRIYGAEFGVTGEITDQWDIYGAYTYLKSKITKSNDAAEQGKELSNTPRHSFNVWTTYSLPWNVDLGLGTQFVDDRFSNFTNARTAPDYWLVDAMVAYHINENVTLRLNVYNLTDQEYIDRVGGGHFIPGGGRSAVIATEFDF